LSSPAILARGLSSAQLAGIEATILKDPQNQDWFARWDFAHDCSLRHIPDLSGHGRHGFTVNRPTRAVTGHNWLARTDSFVEAPSQYNAIHFHDDDLEDAQWQESFRFEVPAELKSGVYAFRLDAKGDATDYLPFFVRPETGKPESAVAVLMPTVSYLAYSNEALEVDPLKFLAALCPLRNLHVQVEEYAYIDSMTIKSTYNHHRDGSGICHITMLRPSLTSMRPSHRSRVFDGPHQLSADLHLIDWLESKQIPYDIITDHDLHREGASLLAPYRTVLTGTHAEYWTLEMLNGLEAYQNHGGRFIYLSGNGLYWVTALDPETQTVCEVRRPNGTRAWQSQPGEGRIGFTGEPGGLWSLRGRPPQRYVGVGFAAQGFDRGVCYRRTAESQNPRCNFIFSGISDELLGDFPALLLNHGAAGFEVDRADFSLGTPAHALIVASSLPLSDSYQFVIESLPLTMPYQGGLTNPDVRSDIVFYETSQGGAVFSVGSIAFCSALSYNSYQNNISRMLENVVTAFARPGPLPGDTFSVAQ
jgi:N,N-dimethylformamidase